MKNGEGRADGDFYKRKQRTRRRGWTKIRNPKSETNSNWNRRGNEENGWREFIREFREFSRIVRAGTGKTESWGGEQRISREKAHTSQKSTSIPWLEEFIAVCGRLGSGGVEREVTELSEEVGERAGKRRELAKKSGGTGNSTKANEGDGGGRPSGHEGDRQNQDGAGEAEAGNFNRG
jgi:hypothetical protein